MADSPFVQERVYLSALLEVESGGDGMVEGMNGREEGEGMEEGRRSVFADRGRKRIEERGKDWKRKAQGKVRYGVR